MAFIPTPSCALATVNYADDNGVVAIQRLYCGVGSPVTETDLEEIGLALFDVWGAQIMPQVTANWKVTGIHIRALDTAEGIEHEYAGSFPIVGGVSSSQQLPNQTSYTVTLNTGLVGRSARGRVYGVGLPITFQDSIRLVDAGRDALQAAWALVHEALIVAGHAWNVVSFAEDLSPRTEGRPLPVLSVNVRYPLATQRRRLS